MKKQLHNKADRKRRQQREQRANDRYWRKKREEYLRRLEAAQAADPVRQLHQRLVNVLYRRLSSDPLYRLMQIVRIFRENQL